MANSAPGNTWRARMANPGWYKCPLGMVDRHRSRRAWAPIAQLIILVGAAYAIGGTLENTFFITMIPLAHRPIMPRAGWLPRTAAGAIQPGGNGPQQFGLAQGYPTIRGHRLAAGQQHVAAQRLVIWLNSCAITPCNSSRPNSITAPRVTLMATSSWVWPAAKVLMPRSQSNT